MLRRHHLPDGSRSHHLTDLHGREIARYVVQPSSLRRIEREPQGTHHELAVTGLTHRHGPQFEVGVGHSAHRTVHQHELTVQEFRHFLMVVRPVRMGRVGGGETLRPSEPSARWGKSDAARATTEKRNQST